MWIKAIDLGMVIGTVLLFYGQVPFFFVRIFHCLFQLILRRHEACRLCVFHFNPPVPFGIARLPIDPLFGWQTKKRIPQTHPHLINSYSVQFIIGFPNRESTFFPLLSHSIEVDAFFLIGFRLCFHFHLPSEVVNI